MGKMPKDIPQQEFLRQSMKTLNMTREEFAAEIGVTPRALNNWLLPDDSREHRSMPEMAWKFIRLILENQRKTN